MDRAGEENHAGKKYSAEERREAQDFASLVKPGRDEGKEDQDGAAPEPAGFKP